MASKTITTATIHKQLLYINIKSRECTSEKAMKIADKKKPFTIQYTEKVNIYERHAQTISGKEISKNIYRRHDILYARWLNGNCIWMFRMRKTNKNPVPKNDTSKFVHADCKHLQNMVHFGCLFIRLCSNTIKIITKQTPIAMDFCLIVNSVEMICVACVVRITVYRETSE